MTTATATHTANTPTTTVAIPAAAVAKLTAALDSLTTLAASIELLTAHVADLQGQLGSARAECARVTTALNDLQELHQQLTSSQRQASAAVDTLAFDLRKLPSEHRNGYLLDCDQITAGLEELAGGLKSADRQGAATETEAAGLVGTVAEMERAAGVLAEEVATLTRELASVQEQLWSAADDAGAVVVVDEDDADEPLTITPEPAQAEEPRVPAALPLPASAVDEALTITPEPEPLTMPAAAQVTTPNVADTVDVPTTDHERKAPARYIADGGEPEPATEPEPTPQAEVLTTPAETTTPACTDLVPSTTPPPRSPVPPLYRREGRRYSSLDLGTAPAWRMLGNTLGGAVAEQASVDGAEMLSGLVEGMAVVGGNVALLALIATAQAALVG